MRTELNANIQTRAYGDPLACDFEDTLGLSFNKLCGRLFAFYGLSKELVLLKMYSWTHMYWLLSYFNQKRAMLSYESLYENFHDPTEFDIACWLQAGRLPQKARKYIRRRFEDFLKTGGHAPAGTGCP